MAENIPGADAGSAGGLFEEIHGCLPIGAWEGWRRVMIPFYILLTSLLCLMVVTTFWLRWRNAFEISASASLALMFLFTGTTHFTSMRFDYVAMIPPALPLGLWVVCLTGILEITGAVGLLIPGFRRMAAPSLGALLMAMVPANIYAALNEIPFRSQPPAAMWIRVPIQLLFIGLLLCVAYPWWAERGESGWTCRGDRDSA